MPNGRAASNFVKAAPNGTNREPCDHKESQKSSDDAHIDSQSRMLSSHTRQPSHHAISYISYMYHANSPTAAPAESMSIEHNTPPISE